MPAQGGAPQPSAGAHEAEDAHHYTCGRVTLAFRSR
jgi:hypothetical protein